jgi:arginine-tRNA-protein transferase
LVCLPIKQTTSRTHAGTDPESLEWCNFDDEYRQKLDRNPYVSLSREKRLADQARSAPDAEAVENRPKSEDVSKGEQPQDKTSSTTLAVPSAASVPGDADYELDSEPSDEDTEIPEGSLFDYNIPGVLKAEEVAKLDLDHWKLLVRNMLIDFEVRFIPSFPAFERIRTDLKCQDLKGWEESSIKDPQSIKGIAAELAATIGPKVMEHSAVSLF